MELSLYNLVLLKEQLSSNYKIEPIIAKINELKNKLTHVILLEGYNTILQNQINFLDEKINEIVNEYANIQKVFIDIDNSINNKVQELFSGNYNNELLSSMNAHEVRLFRNYTINEDAYNSLLKRLRAYTDFHYPALELGCRIGTYTEYLVASDPLYIVDLDQRFIEATMNKFNNIYKHRLRPYVVDLFLPNDKNLNILPSNQFGFIFSWEFFNYLPLFILEYYLIQFYELLRPGGVALIRFNNGDTSLGANSAETRWQSYISGKDVTKLINQLGYELIALENINCGETSWIEIKKPGKLYTVKASQSLGAIREKSN